MEHETLRKQSIMAHNYVRIFFYLYVADDLFALDAEYIFHGQVNPEIRQDNCNAIGCWELRLATEVAIKL